MKGIDKKYRALINAFLAELYIVLLVFFIHYGVALDGETETLLAPIIMLSLFVFSAAVMGYLFLFHPIELYMQGKRKEAISLFLQTILWLGLLILLLIPLGGLL